MTLQLSTATTEFVKVRVTARVAGAVVDVTADTVEACLKLLGETPEEADWQPADWETVAAGVYKARLLVTSPAAGEYKAWVRVHHGDEVVARPAPQTVIVY